jgi:hypothetical protein
MALFTDGEKQRRNEICMFVIICHEVGGNILFGPSTYLFVFFTFSTVTFCKQKTPSSSLYMQNWQKLQTPNHKIGRVITPDA